MASTAALSEHPVAAEAAGEVIGSIVERAGDEVSFALALASGGHTEFLGEISGLVRAVLGPELLVAAAVPGILCGPHGVSGRSALTILTSRSLQATPLGLGRRVTAVGGKDAVVVDLSAPGTLPGWPTLSTGTAEAVTVVGGAVAGPVSVDGMPTPDGSLLLELRAPGLVTRTTPTARPVGAPFVVTRAEGRFLLELGGRPALQRLQETAEQLDPTTRRLLSSSILLGVAERETDDEPCPDDMSVAPVIGADRSRGVVDAGRELAIGTLVQFHVTDPVWVGAEVLERDAGPSRRAGMLVGSTATPWQPDDPIGAAAVAATAGGTVVGLTTATPLVGRLGHVAVRNSSVTLVAWADDASPAGGAPSEQEQGTE